MRLTWVSSLPSVFGFLVFSVCVAIYFEHGGREKLCPNGGCPESAKILNPPSPKTAVTENRQARRPPPGADSSYTWHALILFNTVAYLLCFKNFCYCPF